MTTDQPTPTPTKRTTRHVTRSTAVLVTAAALGLTGSSVVAASAQPHLSSAATASANDVSVLRFGVTFSPQNVIDVPPRAEHLGDYQPGDYVTFSDTLTHPSGDVVGKEAGSGLITKIINTHVQVYYTMAIKLPGRGQIAAQGLSSNAPTKRLAITGGTGQFNGVSGHLDLVEHRNGTGTLTLTLTLTR